MNIVSAILLLILFSACNTKTGDKAMELKTQEGKVSTFNRGNLDNYFDLYEIKPSIVVNNVEGNQTDVQLLHHKIKWIDTDDETTVKINSHSFTLKDKATLNVVWDDRDSVDFVNNWDEIKLYKFNNRELIGIRMSSEPCTGLGCSVNYFLVYDVVTRSSNFFGTFRTDNKLALYDFDNDDKLDYLSKSFKGDAHGATPMEFIYELYSMEEDGHFIQQKNNAGQVFQIKQTTFPNDSTKAQTFEQRWIVRIK